jgi:hypothetical protein
VLWLGQVAASHWAFTCNKMAKRRSSVLAGDSGNSGRQLRHLSAVRLLAEQRRGKCSLCMELDSKFCDLLLWFHIIQPHMHSVFVFEFSVAI